ncbi:MAG: thioredoxin family protein [Verrucomicrobiota bacterium]
MKRTLLSLALFVGIASFGSLASAGEWLTDYAKAIGQAKSENKQVLMDFTGSDWCGWCMKLDREVFEQKEFKDFADKNLVLLKVDFPRSKPQSAQEKAQNEKLSKQFKIEGFPTIVVLNPDGNKAGELGYTPGGPSAFLAELQKEAPKK